MLRKQGKHKIFIGMAPGVGKTYKMLQDANILKKQGVDVVIGLLETHNRQETLLQADGLEIIPRKFISQDNPTLTEMDTEAIINRHPQLVLIDELAHTNIPNSRYQKRYQDVEEILKAGIDVYSTVNIQHLESLNDLIAKITGVVVRERIPDRILDEANQVVVIDVTPETLEERLLAGKIYASNKIEQSLQNFFQRKNLIALRELALREVADTVEEEGEESIPFAQSYPIQERVLVCVSTYPNSLRLLRRGARLANYMNAPLFVLFVKNPDHFLSKTEALHIETCQQLCRDFEGTFLRVEDYNVASVIALTAEQEKITQIVIGESQQSRWKQLLRGSFTQKLMRLIWKKQIDLHIIATNH
ncbi:universal stress protein [Cyanobacterium aponinum FACHB-4101]|uniref:universal stress protein n=1 Tax=Cyanobacterium aponinum TaxID=379064 RepID=UPI00168195DD|nr:universal stress protein [Cyanobacterium aponinum]MBD2394753.1 universal stress protein [Cyanobacterium aponinum FACHB-4101]